MMKSLYRYLLCFILGILLYIILGNKNGFSVGGPDWVVVYGNKYVFDEEQILKDISIGDIVYSGDGKNYVVTADTRESALEEVRKGDLGTEPDGDEYDIIEYTDEMRDDEEEEEEGEGEEEVPPIITDREMDILLSDDIDGKKKLNLKNRDFREEELMEHGIVNLDGLDFSGSDFSKAIGTILKGLNFSNASLTMANFSGHSKRKNMDINTRNDTFDNIMFIEAKLSSSNFSGNLINNCDFRNASLTMANFSKTEINSNGKFPGINAPDINFSNSSIIGKYTPYGDPNTSITYVDFTNANLINADFTGANLQMVDFTRANLRMANFRNARLVNIKFDGADLTGANFEGAILDSSIFLNANLSLAILINITDVDSKALLEIPRGSFMRRIDTSLPRNLTTFARELKETQQIIEGLEGTNISLTRFDYSLLTSAHQLGNLMLRSDIFLQPADDGWVPDDEGNYPNYEGQITLGDMLPEGVGAEDEFNEIFLEDTTDDVQKSIKLQELADGKYESFNSIIKFRESVGITILDVDYRLLEMIKTLKI